MMDVQGEGGVADKLAALYPPDMLEEWLGELEEIGLIERIAESETGAAPSAAAGTVGVDSATMAAAKIAGASLARTGAYLALERLRYRARVEKSPADTVILIVEDDPDQLALADLRVSMAGYKVRVAGSVNAFLQALVDEGAPDLLLLDVMLPDGDGFDVLVKMRRHQALGALPIVLLTAKTDPGDIGRASCSARTATSPSRTRRTCWLTSSNGCSRRQPSKGGADEAAHPRAAGACRTTAPDWFVR